jgi:Ca2+-transporting ATPase
MASQSVWHSHAVQECAAQLNVDLQNGLSAAAVAARRAQHGENALTEAPQPTFWQRLLSQFNNFIVYILLFAVGISFVLGDVIEAAVILAIVVFNAILGVVQEGRAEKALSALKKLAAPLARVRREGHTQTIPARELVVGDVVLLEAGDFVPADLRLVETVNLRIEEAALTGESAPIEKDANAIIQADAPLGDHLNMAYMGTLVAHGRGRGIVIAVGMQTEMGKIAQALQNTVNQETPLQKRLNQLGRMLSIGALIICAVIFAMNAWLTINQGKDILLALKDSFVIAISLVIAAVPEGLPAVVTINLAIGMREMIRRNALIRRLPAVETLGSVTVICSDKTGTLTQNQMTAVRAYVDGTTVDISSNGLSPRNALEARNKGLERLLLGGLLASDARLEPNPEQPTQVRVIGDPTEGALVMAAAKANLQREDLETLYPRVNEVPFDSARKRMTTLHATPEGKGYLAYTKGAPDVILSLCTAIEVNGMAVPLTDSLREQVRTANLAMARDALRVLAVATRHFPALPQPIAPETVENDLTLIGLVGLIDPARPEVKAAITVARRAGIRTAMVTGDHPETARAIAEQIGLLRPEGGAVLRGTEIEGMSDEALVAQLDKVDIFARVSPHHKVRIVEAFRARGHIVAMTGDGVNDAPSLKHADIGVAMGITGTEVSKAAADMVLTDDNYASIVSAVAQGRTIYANIRKFVYYIMTSNLAEITVIFVGTLLGGGAPLTAIQLLWLNLVTDGAPAVALGVEKGDPDVMERPPRPKDEPIIPPSLYPEVLVQLIAMAVVGLIAFMIGRGDVRLFDAASGTALAQTMTFATLSLAQLFRAYTSRSERNTLWQIGLFSNQYMQYAFAASVLGMVAVIHLPFLQPIFATTALTVEMWLVVILLSLAPSLLAELSKVWQQRRLLKARPA